MKKEDLKIDEIVFYCKDCEEIVDTLKVGGKYVYKCKKCGTKNVAFGTEKSIYGFFRLEKTEEEEAAPEVKEAPTQANVEAAAEVEKN